MVVYDDDTYTMGGLMADLLAMEGFEVALVTPFPVVSPWAGMTMEQERIQSRLLELGVTIHTNRQAGKRLSDSLEITCTYTEKLETIGCGTLIPVTSRTPRNLWRKRCWDGKLNGMMRG